LLCHVAIMSMGVITASELFQRIQEETLSQVQLVDVREPQELDLASIPGFQRFSLSESGQWAPCITELLDPEIETIVLCHHGMRSAQMCGFLVQQGFTQVWNVQGGIDAFSAYDSAVKRY
jgi:rhodanese-related sulfurtransferase